MPRILAIGIHPAHADCSNMPGLTPQLVLAYIDSQLQRLRDMGYEVESCLVNPDAWEDAVISHLGPMEFDCILIGAGLRDPTRLLLFEKVVNLVHARAPRSKLCFNTTPADTAEAVRRWI
jgi:hypothetical protein